MFFLNESTIGASPMEDAIRGITFFRTSARVVLFVHRGGIVFLSAASLSAVAPCVSLLESPVILGFWDLLIWMNEWFLHDCRCALSLRRHDHGLRSQLRMPHRRHRVADVLLEPEGVPTGRS